MGQCSNPERLKTVTTLLTLDVLKGCQEWLQSMSSVSMTVTVTVFSFHWLPTISLPSVFETQQKKSCRSSFLESQIINIKLKTNQQKVSGPSPKLSASDWQTFGNFQHWLLDHWNNVVTLEGHCDNLIDPGGVEICQGCIHYMSSSASLRLSLWQSFHISGYPP